jgi:hypothetical protein
VTPENQSTNVFFSNEKGLFQEHNIATQGTLSTDGQGEHCAEARSTWRFWGAGWLDGPLTK